MPRKEKHTKYIEFRTASDREYFKHQLALYKARLMPAGVKTEAEAVTRALKYALQHDFSIPMDRTPMERRMGADDGGDDRRSSGAQPPQGYGK